jgi:hypothetical protein
VAPGSARGLVSENAAVEYDTLKAAYLERLSRFVAWPQGAGRGEEGEPFTIAVIGRDSFVPRLQGIYRQQTILDRPVKIIVVGASEAIPRCHVAFIAASERERLPGIVEQLRHRPVLTIADSEGFAQAGVIINLFQAEHKLRFELNEQAAHDAGLQIGYELRSYARIVNPVKDRP